MTWMYEKTWHEQSELGGIRPGRPDLMNFEVWALVAKSLLVFGTQQADIVCKILPGLVVTRIKCAQVCDSHAL